MFYLNKHWKRSIKDDLKLKDIPDFRTALRHYIDALYNDPTPDSVEKAYKELKELVPDIDTKIDLKVI